MSAIDDCFKLEFKLPDESVILEEFEKVKRKFEDFSLSSENYPSVSILMFNELSRRVNNHFKMHITFTHPPEELKTGRF